MHLRDLFLRSAVTGQQAQFLVGRQDLIRDLSRRMIEERLSGVVYGPRGVGKSSIAWQVATILDGTNPRFNKERMLGEAGPDFLMVMHKCSRYVDTIGDLLMEIVAGAAADHSFSTVLSSYYRSDERLSSIVKKMTLGVPKVLEISREERSESRDLSGEARKLFGTEQEKVNLFNELIYSIAKKIGQKRILFVVDEFDRARDYAQGVKIADGSKKDVEGVGEFIKDADNCQFLFVGIAENVSEILKEHQSAGRKMTGCIVQAPLMSDVEIREIYHLAVRSSNGRLSVTDDFLDLAAKYSNGLPWIAQTLGFEAVRGHPEAAVLKGEDFDPALRSTFDNYAEDADVKESMNILEQANRTDLEILNIVWEDSRGEEELEIRRKLPAKYKQNFDAALKRLQQRNILVRRSGRLAFRDPIVRVFAKKFIDDRE